jgi:thymidylate synthase
MHHLEFATLGETWINLVDRTLNTGARLPDGLLECRGVTVGFPGMIDGDRIIERFGDAEMIAQMKQVFFEDTPTTLGHSYAALMRGPQGRPDLEDIIALLQAEPQTKRAVVTLCGTPGGKVPCLNVIQFLVREGAVQAAYFARGQDAFRKFYADGLCVGAMTTKVARKLELPAGRVTGFLASSHVYPEDFPAIRTMLDQGRVYLRAKEAAAN